jgi:hypothetical protein
VRLIYTLFLVAVTAVRAKLTEAIANRDQRLVFDAQGSKFGEYLDRWLVAG